MDYNRSFGQSDYRGHFLWTEELCEQIQSRFFYHACHQEELERILDANTLYLRSKWGIDLPIGSWESDGVWASLNSYSNNHYGPFLLKFPLSDLIGKNFIAFRRIGDRKRYFFVQYEAQIPIFTKSNSKKLLHKITPKSYFNQEQDRLYLKDQANYDIILTQPLSLRNAQITPVNHENYCIPGKCRGLAKNQARRKLLTIAKGVFTTRFKDNAEMKHFLRQFSDMDGQEVELPELD